MEFGSELNNLMETGKSRLFSCDQTAADGATQITEDTRIKNLNLNLKLKDN